ncbi:MAG: murein biosynthesis integral membrane protein MurJ [Planctomycetaceae bacterium]|nr:murein biosynthesis integral membrane protein MurJ [Planctomycetaceae bacterium]
MNPRRKKLLQSTLIIGVGTLLSRVLGMFRDAATAAMLGMSVGGIMDSFVMAFRLPDVTRRMFGEGSLSVGFIPIFARLWNSDRHKAWVFTSVVLTYFFMVLTVLVVIGEIFCSFGMLLFSYPSRVYIVSQLSMLMLPYLILICLAAITAASLQTLGEFRIPSLIPTILNLVWLLAILVIAPFLTKDPLFQCFLLTGCILCAGFIQLGIQIPFLRRHGFLFHFQPKSVNKELREVRRSFFPSMIGLMGTQLNVLIATVIAWAFSGGPNASIWWLGRLVRYPLQAGAASSIYFSERLYEFPQGLLGIAIATAIYPLLSRHAARKDYQAIREDLGFGLRIILSLAIPSGVGLMLLSDNLAHLLYQRGAFTPADTFRTGDMIFWFSFGVSGFCSIPLLVRGLYSVGEMRIPFRVSLWSVLINFSLGMLLIWKFAEQGLAIAASLTASLHAVWLAVLLGKKFRLMDYRSIFIAIGRSCVASLLMGIVIQLILLAIPGSSSKRDIARIFLSTTTGIAVFGTVYLILGGKDLLKLLPKSKQDVTDFRNRKRKNRKRK